MVFTFNSNFYIQYDKNGIPKKEKPRQKGVLQILKNLHLGILSRPNKRGKGYPFPLLAIGAEIAVYKNFYEL